MTICGGTVTATGGTQGAGIGAGQSGTSHGTLTLDGRTVSYDENGVPNMRVNASSYGATVTLLGIFKAEGSEEVLSSATMGSADGTNVMPGRLTAAQRPTANDLAYTGSVQALLTAPSAPPSGYTLQYSMDGRTWSAQIPTGTNAGSYTVQVKYVGDDSRSYGEGDDVSVTIAPMAAPDSLSATQQPTANDLTYTGSAQALVSAPEELPNGYTGVEYSLDGETWSGSIPTGTNAGSYTVEVRYLADANHTSFSGDDVYVTIASMGIVERINASRVGDMVTMTQDEYVPAGARVMLQGTLDLAGHTVVMDAKAYFFARGNVIDSSEDSSGRLVFKGRNFYLTSNLRELTKGNKSGVLPVKDAGAAREYGEESTVYSFYFYDLKNGNNILTIDENSVKVQTLLYFKDAAEDASVSAARNMLAYAALKENGWEDAGIKYYLKLESEALENDMYVHYNDAVLAGLSDAVIDAEGASKAVGLVLNGVKHLNGKTLSVTPVLMIDGQPTLTFATRTYTPEE